jgi:hypothetical protein
MLFRADALAAIARGEVTLAFRRWNRPRLRAGGRQRIPAGELAILSVDRVETPTDADARAAGFASAADLLAALSGDDPLWRIAFEPREDPRVALRGEVHTAAEIAELQAALAKLRFDAPGYLAQIAASPGRRATDLAAERGLETPVFKRRVRQLKELGLTESLKVGYRLSPRGQSVLAAL